jgi:hypothetical protein
MKITCQFLILENSRIREWQFALYPVSEHPNPVLEYLNSTVSEHPNPVLEYLNSTVSEHPILF